MPNPPSQEQWVKNHLDWIEQGCASVSADPNVDVLTSEVSDCVDAVYAFVMHGHVLELSRETVQRILRLFMRACRTIEKHFPERGGYTMTIESMRVDVMDRYRTLLLP